MTGYYLNRRAPEEHHPMFVVAFALGLVAVFGSQLSPWSLAAPRSWASEPTTDMTRAADVPQKARDVLAEIQKRKGEPPPGYVGGRTFGNRERRLPRGSYREYDVNPKRRGKSRGAERIVIEQRTGKAYYSRDHYETFTPMN